MLLSPAFNGSSPFATSQPSGIPSPSLSALFMFVPWVCSSAFVSPSPSQSAPPSVPSRGSEPSPLTAASADMARNIATSMLIVFLFIFILDLSFFFRFVLIREPAVLSLRLKAGYLDGYSVRNFAGLPCLHWVYSNLGRLRCTQTVL